MAILRSNLPCPPLVPPQCGQKREKKFGLSSDDWGFPGVLKGLMQQMKIYLRQLFIALKP